MFTVGLPFRLRAPQHLDHRGRGVKTEVFSEDDGNFNTSQGDRIARSETVFNDAGQAYEQITHEIRGDNGDTGSTGNRLTQRTCHDELGRQRLSRAPGGPLQRSEYDRLWRVERTVASFVPGAGGASERSTLEGHIEHLHTEEIVIEQSERLYHSETGRVWRATSDRPAEPAVQVPAADGAVAVAAAAAAVGPGHRRGRPEGGEKNSLHPAFRGLGMSPTAGTMRCHMRRRSARRSQNGSFTPAKHTRPLFRHLPTPCPSRAPESARLAPRDSTPTSRTKYGYWWGSSAHKDSRSPHN